MMHHQESSSMVQPLALRTHEDMRPVLRSPDASGPSVHYYMIRGGITKKNITIWHPGTIDGEYIKAFGHYHRDTFIETYTVVSGEGILLLQERTLDADGVPIDHSIDRIRAIPVRPGSVIDIQPNEGHLLVNTGNEWLVTVDNSPVEGITDASAWPHHADYEPIKKLRGFAYYVIEKDGTVAFEKNPAYTHVPDIIFEKQV